MTNSITEAVAVDAAIDAVVLAWTHESKEDMGEAVDRLLQTGRYGEATVQAIASRLDTLKRSGARSFAADLAGSLLLPPTSRQAQDGSDIEVFAIPLIGTGDELAQFSFATWRRRAWATAMKRHGLVAGTSRVCILPGVWSTHDLVTMTPQMIRDVASSVGRSMVAGHDMTLGPVPDLAPLGVGIDGGSVMGAGVALAVVLDENPDTDTMDPLRALFDNDDEWQVDGPMPEAVADPERAWTAAWTEAWTGRRYTTLVSMLPVAIGDAMAATIAADILARTAQTGAGPDSDVKFLAHGSEVDGVVVKAMVDGSSALVYPIDPVLLEACGNALPDRLKAITAHYARRAKGRTIS